MERIKRKKNKLVSSILLMFFFLFGFSGVSQASWGCTFTAIGEYFLPGLGYAITGQYGKMALFGGGRWIAYNHYFDAIESENYQDDPNEIYRNSEVEDAEGNKKTKTEIFMNKETWNANLYATYYSDVGLISMWDMYENNCQKNSDVYGVMMSPWRIDHFYNKWYFWVPIGLLAYNYATFNESQIIEYNLYNGLTQDDLRRDSFPLYYTVGVAEETFFRGVIQNYFYHSMINEFGWSPETSRHAAVWSAAAVFGMAHNGAGFSANSSAAFLMGAYFGYVYQPSVDEFDLTTAIALHAWWDIMVAYTIINHASYFESEEPIQVPIASVAFGF